VLSWDMQNLVVENTSLKAKNAFLEQEVSLLREQVRFLKLKSFGRSKDDLPDSDQLSLFPQDPQEATTEPELEQVSYARKKPGRKGLDPSLPREERIIEIPEKDRVCGCGSIKARIGEETSERLEYKPAEAKVVQIVRHKYACAACEGVEDEGPTVIIAATPNALLPGSMLTPSLMAHILTCKIVDSIPLYRQEKQFKRLGVHLNRSSMARWVIKMAEKGHKIVELLIEEAQKRAAIQLDETTVQVMNEKGRKNTSKSYMWLLRAGPPKLGPPEKQNQFPDQPELVVYWYQRSRSSDVARSIVAGYCGYIQTDEYKGYDFLDGKDADRLGWIHVLCMAHVRRKFVEAARIAYGNKRSNMIGVSAEIVKDIKDIYRMDREVRYESSGPDQLTEQRQSKVLPMLKTLHAKITKLSDEVVPKSKLGMAVGYAVRTLPKIMKYVDCPNLTMDNNDTENKVRPFALGRKNWLMANTPSGAHALATWFSIIETAKANGWNPHQYLLHLLTGLRDNTDITNLMPTLPPPAED